MLLRGSRVSRGTLVVSHCAIGSWFSKGSLQIVDYWYKEMSESTSIECPLRRKEERSPASSFERVPDPIVVPSRSKVRDRYREGRRSFQACSSAWSFEFNNGFQHKKVYASNIYVWRERNRPQFDYQGPSFTIGALCTGVSSRRTIFIGINTTRFFLPHFHGLGFHLEFRVHSSFST